MDRMVRKSHRRIRQAWALLAFGVGLVAFQVWWPIYTYVTPWLRALGCATALICVAQNVRILRGVRAADVIIRDSRDAVYGLEESVGG